MEILKVSAKSSPNGVAGAIAGLIKENGKVEFNVEEILKVIECLDLNFDEVNDIFFSNKLPKS